MVGGAFNAAGQDDGATDRFLDARAVEPVGGGEQLSLRVLELYAGDTRLLQPHGGALARGGAGDAQKNGAAAGELDRQVGDGAHGQQERHAAVLRRGFKRLAPGRVGFFEQRLAVGDAEHGAG